MNIRIGLCSLLATISLCASAGELYSWVDENGTKHFSNKPPQGAQRNAVRGEVKSSKLTTDNLNTMQPYVIPEVLQKNEPVQPKTDDGSVTQASGSASNTSQNKGATSAQGNSNSDKDKSELKNLNQQLEDYDREKRMNEIKDKEHKTLANTPKPQSLNKKLKTYSDAKKANQDNDN